MKKNVYVLAAAVWMAAASVTACGQSTASAEQKTSQQKTSQETQMQETQAQETQAQETQMLENKVPESEIQDEIVIQSETPDGYKDNFAVDGAASAAFGARIKEAVAAKDIEALADLASYPLYMGFADGGVSIESREDFIALGTDRVFTAEMVDAMVAAEENGLNPSMAGFALTKDGKPNITFGVTDGELAVKGMNY